MFFKKINVYHIIIIIHHLILFILFQIKQETTNNISIYTMILLISISVYYRIYMYFNARSEGFFYCMWINGNLMHLIFNILSIIIYPKFYSLLLIGNDKSNINMVFKMFNFLFHNNFITLISAHFILIFSLFEAEIIWKYNLHKNGIFFNSKKYYVMFIVLIIFEFIIVMFLTQDSLKLDGDSIYIINNQAITFTDFFLTYVAYTNNSAIISTIFSSIVYFLIFNYHKNALKDRLNCDHKDSNNIINEFYKVQCYSFFIINWNTTSTSYFFLSILYILFFTMASIYKPQIDQFLPTSHIVNLSKIN